MADCKIFVTPCIELSSNRGASLVLYANRAAALGAKILECAGAGTATSRRHLENNEALGSLNRAGTSVQIEQRQNENGAPESGVRINWDTEILWLSISNATSIGQDLIDLAEKTV